MTNMKNTATKSVVRRSVSEAKAAQAARDEQRWLDSNWKKEEKVSLEENARQESVAQGARRGRVYRDLGGLDEKLFVKPDMVPSGRNK